jgi:hypothetical protein
MIVRATVTNSLSEQSRCAKQKRHATGFAYFESADLTSDQDAVIKESDELVRIIATLMNTHPDGR